MKYSHIFYILFIQLLLLFLAIFIIYDIKFIHIENSYLIKDSLLIASYIAQCGIFLIAIYTISNNKLNSQEKYNSIKFDDFNFFEKTEKDEMKKFYFVFYNNITDFKDVTTYNTSEISYSFDGNKVVVNK